MSDSDNVSFPIVVSGPSGVGKTTLCHGLMERDPTLAFSISATTRNTRTNEKNDKDYHFVSREKFEQMIARGEFAEWAVVHDEFYGTPKKWLDAKLSQGISVLLDIDVQGGVQITSGYPQGVSIFVIPPSFHVLEDRLRTRKSDSEEAVRLRLKNALREMEYIDRYAYVVVNDTIDRAVSQMESIVSAERCKRRRILEGTSWKKLMRYENQEV